MPKAKKSGTVYGIGQSKGGAGKTTFALHMAVALTESGHDVLALDSDYTNNHLLRLLRLRSQTLKDNPELGPRAIRSMVELSHRKLTETVMKARAEGISVVIDVSAAHNELFLTAMAVADVVIMPTRQGYLDKDAWERLSPYLDVVADSRKARGRDRAKLYSVLTDFRPSQIGRALQEGMEAEKKITFLGTVPHSDRLAKSTYEGFAFWEACPNAPQAMALKDMMHRCIRR